jgi:hypothetical protein
VLKRDKKMTDLPIKDLQALRQQYVDQREDVKKAAELEERDLNETDVTEMERLASEIRKVDVQLKVKREDARIAESAVMAGETGRNGSHELRKMSKRFDLASAVRDLAQGKRLTGVAAEYTEEAVKEARMAGVSIKGQLSIPDVALRALGDAGEFGAGSGLTNSPNMVGTTVAQGVSALANPTLFQTVGGRVLTGLTSNVNIPIVTSAAAIASAAEGADVSNAATAIGNKSLTPTRYGAFVTVTEQLMMQGGPAVEQLITNDMVTELNRQIDKAAFDAIIGASDGDDATAVDAAGLLAAEASLAGAGVNLNNVQFVVDSRMHEDIAGLALINSIDSVIDRSGATLRAMGYPYYVTDLMTPGQGTTPTGILADFNMAGVLGFFGGLDIVVNPYTLDLSHQVRISVHRYADASALHGGAAYTFHDQAA